MNNQIIDNYKLLLFLQIKTLIFKYTPPSGYECIYKDNFFTETIGHNVQYYYQKIDDSCINNLSDSVVYVKLHGDKILLMIKINDFLVIGQVNTGSNDEFFIDLNKSKGSFISNMSHEFRTPLNGIIGMTQILKDTNLSKEQKFCVNNIEKCNYDLLGIVNDILDYSKLDNGSLELDLKPFSIKNCIESSIDINISKIRETNNNVSYHIDDDVPEFILGDHQRLKQIFINLLNNSLKFTKNGSIKILVHSLNQSSKSADYNLLEFEVIDTGLGIPKELIPKLFKPFVQASNSYREGTGLGLVICKKLCNLMDGDITIKTSEINKGTCISVKIKTKAAHIIDKSIDANSHLKGKYILIVDDNPINRMSLMKQCEKWGMISVACSNIHEAIFYAKKHEYYCALIDIVMPENSGIWLAEKLVKEYKISYPLIALSSLKEIPKESEDFFLHFLFKPVPEDMLRDILINVLPDFFYCKKDCDSQNSIKSKQILIVDDIAINRQILEIFLIKMNIDKSCIKMCNSGETAIDAIKNNTFDYVFLDIRMPGGISGIEVYNYIKNNNLKRHTKFIAMTAYLLEKKNDYIEKEHFDYCLYKPISDANSIKDILFTPLKI